MRLHTPEDRGMVDMGMNSNLVLAKELFPSARRAVMYTPMDAANKSRGELEADILRLAREFAPCDLVVADVDATTPDERILEIIDLTAKVSR